MSDLQIIDVEQGTPEWFAARLGLPTASMFSTVMASGRGGGESKTRRKYMLQLVGERITGQPAEQFTTAAMDRGHAMEPEARELYELVTGNTVQQVGFMRRTSTGAGYSPDGLVGEDGAIEIKTMAPHILIDVLLRQEMPPEHRAQVQGGLWVSARKWCDFIGYWPGLPPFVKRIHRDDAYIAQVAVAVREFNAELDAIEKQIRGM